MEASAEWETNAECGEWETNAEWENGREKKCRMGEWERKCRMGDSPIRLFTSPTLRFGCLKIGRMGERKNAEWENGRQMQNGRMGERKNAEWENGRQMQNGRMGEKMQNGRLTDSAVYFTHSPVRLFKDLPRSAVRK
jgi:hypothetical protein